MPPFMQDGLEIAADGIEKFSNLVNEAVASNRTARIKRKNILELLSHFCERIFYLLFLLPQKSTKL